MTLISLQQFAENLVHTMRGAQMMLFVVMCASLYSRRKENSILNFLFWLLVVMSTMLCVSFGFMVEGLKNSEPYSDFVKLLDMCLIPLIGGFLLTIVMPDYINSRRAALLLIPSIALMAVHAFTHNRWLYQAALIYAILVAATTFILTVIISIRYDRYLINNFSNIDHKTVGWVRKVVFVFAAWYLAWNFVTTLDNPMLDSAYYLFLISIWTFIYRYSIKHVTAFHTQELFEKPSTDETELPQTEMIDNQLASKLKSYMNKKRPWLNPLLTLQELAMALGSNRTYLSEYFNNTLGITFYDYLNNFRIKRACELLLSDSNLSTQLVGELSGFNSLSTFRRAFEKHIGCTPAAYRKQNSI